MDLSEDEGSRRAGLNLKTCRLQGWVRRDYMTDGGPYGPLHLNCQRSPRAAPSARRLLPGFDRFPGPPRRIRSRQFLLSVNWCRCPFLQACAPSREGVVGQRLLDRRFHVDDNPSLLAKKLLGPRGHSPRRACCGARSSSLVAWINSGLQTSSRILCAPARRYARGRLIIFQ
jgi:hypothetical protein